MLGNLIRSVLLRAVGVSLQASGVRKITPENALNGCKIRNNFGKLQIGEYERGSWSISILGRLQKQYC